MACDLVEADQEFTLTAKLDGFEKKDIDLQVDGNNVVTLTAERSMSKDEQNDEYHLKGEALRERLNLLPSYPSASLSFLPVECLLLLRLNSLFLLSFVCSL